jgi:hypothetical protein
MLYRVDCPARQSEPDRRATELQEGLTTMARAISTTNDKALDAFIAAKAEIDRLLADLATLSADHFNASTVEINWGHVGSAAHIRDRLREIASFAAGNG